MPHTVALYDNQSLRAVETAAHVTLGSGFALMQRAGLAAWRHVLARWPQAQRIVVACGPGNNGGDGYVLATHALHSGRDVHVVRLAEPRTEPGRQAQAEFVAAGGRCVDFSMTLPDADLIVDGVFGIGLTRAPDSDSSRLIDAINTSAATVLALDVPSGVDAGTGHVPGTAVRATSTLQFLAAHRGLLTGASLDHCGRLEVASLEVGLDPAVASALALHADALADWLTPRARDSHKGSNGHVLCIGGEHGSGGAIALCAEAALRSGAGLVSVATRAEHVAALLTRRPEAMVVGIDDPHAIPRLLQRANVVAIGTGLGQQAWGGALWNLGATSGKALVIDADALNLLAAQPCALPPDAILTPHPGEAGRLLGIETGAVQSDRFAAARQLAERYGCVIVLKGAGTIVAAPDCVPRVIAAGNPGMAVGGMGDLLTGVIAALRAQRMDAFPAACCGALLHAVAGDAAARNGGERGLLPSDLLPHLRALSNPDTTP
jgi:ADP-dependent NAD(P)H-hydrate dehydratase / NAD(P)H-hydrate epimerase